MELTLALALEKHGKRTSYEFNIATFNPYHKPEGRSGTKVPVHRMGYLPASAANSVLHKSHLVSADLREVYRF